ncbi:sensor histidine kinase [Paraburkholderia sp. J76]|uniref:sensor histidine kinase n=1 Tax=Paraburkholderia sp. J76 TaxID=2805439 RepID=UPI002ABE5074|nr:histidine kinase dimerization/phospho-acceptor domain-containing protein [Paraburkholderia sp. J76]
MAFYTRTRGDADTREKPGASTSTRASKLASKIVRHKIAELLKPFRGPVATLNTGQALLVKRELLKSLSRRAVYWMALPLLGSSLWLEFGSWIKTPDNYRWFRFIWVFGLWGVAAPLAIYLFKKTIALPVQADVNAVDRMHWAWAALITSTSLWWGVGSFGLIPPTWPNGHGYYYGLGRYNILELTLISHVFTLLLLAPSLRATLGSLLLSAIPFTLGMAGILFTYRPVMLYWLTIQLIGYFFIAWFICEDQKHACVKELILVEARSQAEAAAAEKNQFVAAISHDLRQPLTTLGLKLNYIERHIEPTHLAGDLSVAQRQVDAMEGMINGTLDICRLESGT